MKKLLVLLLLVGCSSDPKERPLTEYKCSIFGGHGVWAHVEVNAHYVEEAEEVVEEMRQRLVKMEKIPSETGVMCGKSY